MSILVNSTVKSRTFWVNIAMAVLAAVGSQMDVVAQELQNTPDGTVVASATAVVTVVNLIMRVLTQVKANG